MITDDARRIPIRLEAKVKIGTVVASLKKVELGTPPPSPSPMPSPQPSELPSSQTGGQLPTPVGEKSK